MFKSKRLYVNVAVFGLFLFVPIAPWYASFAIAAIAAWYMPGYYELIALGFLMDMAYESAAASSVFSQSFALPLTVLAVCLVFGLEALKKRIRSRHSF